LISTVALARNRQLELPRYDKNGQRRVGPHPGAGRKPKGLRAGVTHARRAELDPSKPLHITLRVVAAVAALRTAKAYRAIRRALQVSAFNQLGLRIVHFSVQRTHIHLICEADDKASLARGMQSFKISAAKQLNRALRRRGKVFADRYHVEILRTPTQTSHAISYVLNNWRKHGEQRRTIGLYRGRIDPFSSGAQFYGWAEPRMRTSLYPAGYERVAIAAPLTWMLGIGYLRGGPISVFAIPSRRATASDRR
jgi:REP element-mobilizing transposase RayT